MVKEDGFFIDYDKQQIILWWNEVEYVFDLKEGDVGDFWDTIKTPEGVEYDVNFFQEDESSEQGLSIYELEWGEDGYISTGRRSILELLNPWVKGNPENYFNRILDSDWEVENVESYDVVTLRLWVRQISVRCRQDKFGNLHISDIKALDGGYLPEEFYGFVTDLMKKYYSKSLN